MFKNVVLAGMKSHGLCTKIFILRNSTHVLKIIVVGTRRVVCIHIRKHTSALRIWSFIYTTRECCFILLAFNRRYTRTHTLYFEKSQLVSLSYRLKPRCQSFHFSHRQANAIEPIPRPCFDSHFPGVVSSVLNLGPCAYR